jgi:hypothetical protein
MEEKYKKAIVAGLICGIILVILSFMGIVVMRLAFGAELASWAEKYSNVYTSGQSMPQVSPTIFLAGLIGLVLMALGALAFVTAGVLAVRMGTPYIKNRNDAIILGAVAGAVAEVVHRPFTMVFSFIMDLIRPMAATFTGVQPTAPGAVTSAIGQLVCCFPFVLVCGIILAVLGALAYTVLKPSPG